MHSTENAAPCGIPEQSVAAAIVDFARVLKQAGFSVFTPSIMDALAGAACTGMDDVGTFRSVLRATFMTSVEQSVTFDRLFEEFWLAAATGALQDTQEAGQAAANACRSVP